MFPEVDDNKKGVKTLTKKSFQKSMKIKRRKDVKMTLKIRKKLKNQQPATIIK